MERSPVNRKLSKYKRKALGDPATHLRDIMARPFLTKRDMDILLSLYAHRCLTSHQIREIHFSEQSQGEVICRRRLRKMFDEMLIERFFVDVGEGNGSSPQHVMLDTLGAKVVAGLLNLPLQELKWTKAHNDAALPYMRHTIELNEYYVSLLRRARLQKAEVLHFITESHLLHTFQHWGRTFTFNPDAYFQYWTPDNRGVAIYLEWDRGTMSPKQFQEKAYRYKAFYESGEFEKAGHPIMPTILTIVPDMERAERLKRCIEDVDRTDLRWLFGLPQTSLQSGKFLEAHEKEPTTLLT